MTRWAFRTRSGRRRPAVWTPGRVTCTCFLLLGVFPPHAFGAGGPRAVRVIPCPLQASQLAAFPAPPTPLPGTVVQGEREESYFPLSQPGSRLYGTSFPAAAGAEPLVGLSLSPSGFSCSARAGPDGSRYQMVEGPTNHDGIETIFEPGAQRSVETLACEFIPAVRASMQQSDPAQFAARCPPTPSGDVITQLTGIQVGATGPVALVQIPPGGTFAIGAPVSSDPTWALVRARREGARTVSVAAIRCTLPVAELSLCFGSLVAFLWQANVVLAYTEDGAVSVAESLKTAMSGPSAFAPSAPCDLESVELKLSGQATAGIFEFGDEGTVNWKRRSDAKWAIDADGKFKVGLGGVFGEGVHTTAGGGAGVGTEGSVAGGLELGLGMGFETDTGQSSRSFIDALGAADTSPPQNVSLSSTTVAVGAWLSGDIGVASTSGNFAGNIDAAAVLGDRTDFKDGSEVDNEYYLEGTVAGQGNGRPPTDSLGTTFSVAGFGNGSLVVGEIVNTAGEPTLGEVEVNLAVGGGAQADRKSNALVKEFHGLASLTAGDEIQAKMTLNLTDPNHQSSWSALASDQNGTTIAGLVGNSAAAGAIALARAMTITVVRYQTEVLSGSISGKFGDGVGIGVTFDGEANIRKAVGAAFKAPDSLVVSPWSECLPAGGTGI